MSSPFTVERNMDIRPRAGELFWDKITYDELKKFAPAWWILTRTHSR